MHDANVIFPACIFLITALLIMWRPFGVNESVPAAIGAAIIFVTGTVPLADVYRIFGIVSGAAITIISTIVMSIVLESIGFFQWAAYNLADKAGGSGKKLYWYINLLCFLMTLFFNNDGSILITTPIIIQTLHISNLKQHQKIPYLLSGAIIATGASAPIGVSNLANLIALKIVGLDLNSYAAMIFVPSIVGIMVISYLLYLYFKRDIPDTISVPSPAFMSLLAGNQPVHSVLRKYHPLSVDPNLQRPIPIDWNMFRICIAIVVLTRISFFALSPLGVGTEWPAITGAMLLIVVRWVRQGKGARDVLRKTPWHILLFAFSVYIIIYGLHNSGLTSIIVQQFGESISNSHFNAIFNMGIILTILSNLCNNLPSVMIGTLSLMEMNLDLPTLQIAYLAAVIGSDIGALLLPMGTLASLLWMYILRKNKIAFTWGQYIKTTIVIIPVGLLVSLILLYLWTEWLFF